MPSALCSPAKEIAAFERRPPASDGAQTLGNCIHLRLHGQRCMLGALRVASSIPSTASEAARRHHPALSARQRRNRLASELQPPASDDKTQTHSNHTHPRSCRQRCMRGAFPVDSDIPLKASATARPHHPARSARQRRNQLASELRPLHLIARRHIAVACTFARIWAALHAWRISSSFWHRIHSF